MNRIEEALKDFAKYEARMEKLFNRGNMHVNRGFQREKLDHMEKILSRPKSGLSFEEKMTRRILLHEKKDLERRLFPNRTKRIMRRIFVPLANALMNAFIGLKDRKVIKRVEGELRENGYLMEGKLTREKNGKLVSPVQKIDLAGGQRLEYQVVSALSNNRQGKTEGISASLIARDGAVTKNFFKVENDKLPSHRDMISLLKGKTVTMDGTSGKYRAKLDFNDRDTSGSYKLVQAVDKNHESLSAVVPKEKIASPRVVHHRKKGLGI